MARKTGVVEGNDLMLFVNTSTTESPTWSETAHATNHTISWSAATKERKTKTTGKWAQKIVTGYSCQIKCEALVSYKDGVGYKEFMDMFKKGVSVLLKFSHKEVEAQDEFEQGEFLITNIDENAAAGEDASYSATFENFGEVETKKAATPANLSAGGEVNEDSAGLEAEENE